MSIIAFLTGGQRMEQALRAICGRDKERKEDGQGQSEDAVVSLPYRDVNHSCVHGLTGCVGSKTWGGRVHDCGCTGWVVHPDGSLCSNFLFILEESGQFKGLEDLC